MILLVKKFLLCFFQCGLLFIEPRSVALVDCDIMRD